MGGARTGRESVVRRFLDALYLGAGCLSAFFLAAIAVSIAAQVVGRYLGYTIDSTEISGFCLAASTFLGLAHTLESGAHIRINLLVRYASGRARRWIELWCTGFAALGLAYFTYWAFDLVLYSYLYHELSPGLMAVPFWIPQSAMVLGLLLLTVAVIDEFCRVWWGRQPGYESGDGAAPPEAEPGAARPPAAASRPAAGEA